MINNIINYFESLNGVGQALFIVGVLLVITFIVLLIFVLKPEPKSKKVYGENSYTHSEAELEEKLKDIDNITDDDININNDKTRNLKSIVDELKSVENKNTTLEEMIERYEDEQENTAIISVEELLKKNKPFSYERRETRLPYDNKKSDTMLIVAGPEGGFSLEEENYLIDNGFIPTTLGSNILRAETVPLYVLSVINYEYGGEL